MIAAIYAHKSTDQTGVADDQKSVARQVEHARVYAAQKGWTVDDAHVYFDDGISGAEFARRPGFQRLMKALQPRPPFQALRTGSMGCSRSARSSLESCRLQRLKWAPRGSNPGHRDGAGLHRRSILTTDIITSGLLSSLAGSSSRHQALRGVS